jgi:hypothetical protein
MVQLAGMARVAPAWRPAATNALARALVNGRQCYCWMNPWRVRSEIAKRCSSS